MLTSVIEIKNVLTKGVINLQACHCPPPPPPLNKSVLTAHLSVLQTRKYILAKKVDRHMGELWCKNLFFVSQTEKRGRTKKGRSLEDESGGEKKQEREKKVK